jgi:hypothetical protein
MKRIMRDGCVVEGERKGHEQLIEAKPPEDLA